MQFDRKFTLRDAVYFCVLFVGLVGSYFALKYDVADATEAAARAEKLSAQNTQQISELNKAVGSIATSIAKQNETVKWQYIIQDKAISNNTKRLDGISDK